jgi:hypothetical protein
VRAQIAIWHLNERQFRSSSKWTLRAMEYLRLADERLQSCRESAACDR